MDPHASDHDPAVPVDAELDALLRRTRPQPDAAWVRETRERLLPELAAAPRAWRRLRPAVVGATLGLAATITAVALVGGGPLGGGGGDDARAKQECRTVYVTKVEPLGEVRRQTDGTVEVQTVQRPVTREQRDCR